MKLRLVVMRSNVECDVCEQDREPDSFKSPQMNWTSDMKVLDRDEGS